MFKLNPSPTFKAVVKIPRAGEEPGDLEFIFKHKDSDDAKAFVEKAAASKDEAETLLEITDGWPDGAADGKFSKEALAKLLKDFHGAGFAIMRTYFKELAQGRTGN